MRYYSKFVIVHVHGFKYLSGSRTTFTLNECPIVAPTSSTSKGVGVSGLFFSVGDTLALELKPNVLNGNINIANYVTHLQPPVHNGSSWMLLSRQLDYLKSFVEQQP